MTDSMERSLEKYHSTCLMLKNLLMVGDGGKLPLGCCSHSGSGVKKD